MFVPNTIRALQDSVSNELATFLRLRLTSRFVRKRVEEQLWTRTIADLVSHHGSTPIAIPILANDEDTERGRDGTTIKASVLRELRRRVRQYPGAYNIPLVVLLVLQMYEYTLLTVINICAWAWEGCQAYEKRTAGVREFFPLAILGSIVPLAALHRDGVHLSDVELRHALRWMWYRPFTDERGASVSFSFAAILAMDRISESVATKLIAHAPDAFIAAIVSAKGDQQLTRNELTALAGARDVLRAAAANERLPRLLNGIRELRNRTDPGVLLHSICAIGDQRALALHQFTPLAEVVIAASAMIDARGTTLMRYIAAWRACQERASMPFEAYVACTMAWDAATLPRVWRALPDAVLLQQIIKSDGADVLVRALDSGFPARDIASGGFALLRLLARVSPARWDIIRDAFSVVPTTSFVEQFVRLPAAVRAEPHVRAMLRESPLRITQPSVLRLVHAAGDMDIPLAWDLLCACDEAGPWPSRQVARDVYGLALRFRDAGRASAEAIACAREACSDLRPRARVRAIRDAGYFRRHVLDHFSVPITEATTIQVARAPLDDTAQAPDATREPKHRGRDVPDTVQHRDHHDADVRDLRSLHTHLNLRDLVPSGVDARDAAAIIVHGFCELGKGRPRVGEQYFPVEFALQNVRNRCDASADAVRIAWRWLESIGIIGRKKKGEVCTLRLANRPRDSTADAVARRVRKFLHDLRVSHRA